MDTLCSRTIPACAEALDKYRINPGNVGFKDKRDIQFSAIVEKALEFGKPVRIGVNWGSLDQELLTRLMDENAGAENPLDAQSVVHEAMVQSALLSAGARGGDRPGCGPHHSVRQGFRSAGPGFGLHNAGGAQFLCLASGPDRSRHGSQGRGLIDGSPFAILLQQGIGDTIRCSLTPEPGGDRCEEVRVSQEVLQTLRLRSFRSRRRRLPGLRAYH